MTKQGASLRVPRRLTVLLISVFSMLPCLAAGRENSVTAGLAVREGYDSNIHRTEENHVLQWTTTIIPSLDFISKGQTDRFSLLYAPSLQVVDHESAEPGVDKPADFAEQTVNHELTINAEKTLVKDLQLLITEEYVKADDPDLRPRPMFEPAHGVYVSESIERRRYWTNAAALAMRYTYAQDSTMAIGYDNSRLENEDARLPGSYDRHHPTLTVDHHFNEQWRTVAGYAYTKADFQQAEISLPAIATTDDLIIHNPTMELDYNPWPHATAFGSYSLEKYHYQDSLRDDYDINDGRLGWRQEFGHHSTAALSAGYSQTNWDDGGSDGAFNFDGHVTTTLGLANVSCGAAKGFEPRYFDGTSNGLSKYWLLEAAFSYQLTQDLTADLAASYREDEFLEARQGIEEDVTQAATGFSYRLNRWAALSLRYIFHDFATTADISDLGGDYNDHRLFMEIRATKELWRR